MTAHCSHVGLPDPRAGLHIVPARPSRGARHSLRQSGDLLLELSAALRVVGEHVEACARGSEQHDPGRPRQREAMTTASRNGRAGCTATAPARRLRNSGAASPIVTTALARGERLAKQAQIAALEAAAHDRDKVRVEALDGSSAASTFVAFESLT